MATVALGGEYYYFLLTDVKTKHQEIYGFIEASRTRTFKLV
jgi:hypothetical protein